MRRRTGNAVCPLLAIRSGDYYMFDYESDQEDDEGKQDEATFAQEQVNDRREERSQLKFLSAIVRFSKF